jgi:hypothetical protein
VYLVREIGLYSGSFFLAFASDWLSTICEPWIVTINLANQLPDLLIRKQEEDLPPIRTVITEYQTEVKTCPCCAQQWQAVGCPEHIRYEFQYGPRIKALRGCRKINYPSESRDLNEFHIYSIKPRITYFSAGPKCLFVRPAVPSR